MTVEDKKEIKEMLHDIIAGYRAIVESQYEIIRNDLNFLKEHNKRQNGSLQHHQDAIIELGNRTRDLEESARVHPSLCPMIGKVDALEAINASVRLKEIEDHFIKRMGFWEYMKSAFAMTIALLTVVSLGYGLYKLIM